MYTILLFFSYFPPLLKYASFFLNKKMHRMFENKKICKNIFWHFCKRILKTFLQKYFLKCRFTPETGAPSRSPFNRLWVPYHYWTRALVAVPGVSCLGPRILGLESLFSVPWVSRFGPWVSLVALVYTIFTYFSKTLKINLSSKYARLFQNSFKKKTCMLSGHVR